MRVNRNCRHGVYVHYWCRLFGVSWLSNCRQMCGCSYDLSAALLMKFACLNLCLSVNTLSLRTENIQGVLAVVIRFSIVCPAAGCLASRRRKNRNLKKTAQWGSSYLHRAPSIIRVIKARWVRWAGYVARMGKKKNACRVLVWKREGKRPLGRSRRRCDTVLQWALKK